MLRRTLIGWQFAETLDEVTRYCMANDFDQVMWKIDAEAFTYAQLCREVGCSRRYMSMPASTLQPAVP